MCRVLGRWGHPSSGSPAGLNPPEATRPFANTEKLTGSPHVAPRHISITQAYWAIDNASLGRLLPPGADHCLVSSVDKLSERISCLARSEADRHPCAVLALGEAGRNDSVARIGVGNALS
jgi:hypothetical protein